MAYNMAPYAPWMAPYPNMMQQPQQPAPQAMTPPMIHADIIQVAGEAEADAYPIAAGSPPQMMMSRDETEIYIKTMLANGQHELTVYAKRAPAPAKSGYVTREELEERLRTLAAGKEEA